MKIYIILAPSGHGEYACFWEAHRTFESAENSILSTYKEWQRAYPKSKVISVKDGRATIYSLISEENVLSSCKIIRDTLFDD